MKRDAFGGMTLSQQATGDAHEQRLFAPRTENADDADAPSSVPTNARTDARALAPTATPAQATPQAPSLTSGPEVATVHAQGAPHETALASAGRRPPARTLERHSYDIFQDQAWWMNRLKLDMEQRHGVKLTGNLIVQFALEVVRADFERHGERSKLFGALVNGADWLLASERDSSVEGEKEDGV